MLEADRTPIDDFLAEAQRQVAICNGCRYCEGYCAVFPAMERLPLLGEGDLTYLANLCHDCRACFQACMYAPPHPFAVEIPTLLSQARERSYAEFARPRWLARAFGHGPLAIGGLTLAGALAFVVLAWIAGRIDGIVSPSESTRGFYDVLPYAFMVVPTLLLSLFVAGAVGWGLVEYWRASHGGRRLGLRAWLVALREIATLRWMKGGGEDCYYPDVERPSALRRRLHHLTAYGFVLAFVSTTLAAFYENVLDESAPFPYTHPVVLFGVVGGIGMCVGTTGLLWLKRRPRVLGSAREAALNVSFIVVLDLTSASGLLLLVLRDAAVMGALLVFHLGTVVALYLTTPYGKFVHAVYRSAAVLRSAAERAADDAGRAGPEPAAVTPAPVILGREHA